MVASRTFHLTNVGHIPVSFTTPHKLLQHSGFSVDLGEKVKALPPYESLDFTVTFDPAAIKCSNGKRLIEVPFNVSFCARACHLHIRICKCTYQFILLINSLLQYCRALWFLYKHTLHGVRTYVRTIYMCRTVHNYLVSKVLSFSLLVVHPTLSCSLHKSLGPACSSLRAILTLGRLSVVSADSSPSGSPTLSQSGE